MRKWIVYLSVTVHAEDYEEAEAKVKAELDGTGIKIRSGTSVIKWDEALDAPRE